MPDEPIAWRAIAKAMPVYSCEGQLVGHVDELLGSNAEDIFHGVVISHRAFDMHKVAIPADDIDQINRHGLVSALSAAEIASLPRHTPERAYDLGWVTTSFTYEYGARDYRTVYVTQPGWVSER